MLSFFPYFFVVVALVFSLAAETNMTASSPYDFQFRVKNSAGSAYTISCPFAYNENYYDSSHVKSTTNPNNLVNSGYSWDLKYQRIDAGHAEGGRCETASSIALTGNGRFSASIFIHSNVNPSDGVFSLAIVNKVTSQQTELVLLLLMLGILLPNLVLLDLLFHF